MVILPFHQVMIPVQGEAAYALMNGGVEAGPEFERRNALLASAALVTLFEGKQCYGSPIPTATHTK